MTHHLHRWSYACENGSHFFACPCGERLPVMHYAAMLYGLQQQIDALRQLVEELGKEKLEGHSWHVCRGCSAPWFAGQPVNHAPGCWVGRVLADSAGEPDSASV